MFLADLCPQTLQNLTVIMLHNCLTWRSKLLMNSALTIKIHHPHSLEVQHDLSLFFWTWRGWVHAVSFLGYNNKHSFIFCSAVFLIFKQILMQICLLLLKITTWEWLIALNIYNIKHPQRSNTEGYIYKPHTCVVICVVLVFCTIVTCFISISRVTSFFWN